MWEHFAFLQPIAAVSTDDDGREDKDDDDDDDVFISLVTQCRPIKKTPRSNLGQL